MNLEMINFVVKDVSFGDETAFNSGVLTINEREFKDILLQDADCVESLEVAITKPGDKTRVIHILDAIEPRVKISGNTSAFPGFLGSPNRVGTGITGRLTNLAILTSAEFPEYDPGSMMGANEAIIDMSGNGKPFSPFSNMIDVVLVFKKRPDATEAAFSSSIRIAGLRAASYLAETVKMSDSSHLEKHILETNRAAKAPRVAAVFLLSSLSLPLRESFVYGHPVGGMLPIVLHPNEVMDGAILGNYFVYAGVRNVTYFYQNNPTLEKLYHNHTTGLNLTCAIVTRAGDTSSDGKLNQATTAAGIARLMQLDGVIVMANAGGQQCVDFMTICEQMEKAGIKTVGIAAEMADANGSDFGFPSFVNEANALVSTGNREELVKLSAMEYVIGGESIMGFDVWAGKEVVVPTRSILCSNTQVGAWNISAKGF